ncbi:sn-glycerol-1-phosphate dehydrogenase [Eubacteriales bacterium OttesenSCG-928-A19]|nr:sn-glycerol-1-phosphate dehydrogenase [Eubacteriales bacterium OttesenSCG-928-A19]
MIDLSKADLKALLRPEGIPCECCGQVHTTDLRTVEIGAGAVKKLSGALAALGVKRPFVVCDENTHGAAGARVEALLKEAGIPYSLHILRPHAGRVEPQEFSVGGLAMAFDASCDFILAVGSGVINDCCKVLGHIAKLPTGVVATAPSMDGYASNSSSMIIGGVKVTLYNACPVMILADTDIVKEAPMRMLRAGFGDMVAKYVSICEWRMSNLVTGEYYCENVAGLVRRSLKAVVDSAEGLTARDPRAVESVVEGLILSGVAMSYAKSSRPASGLEHYYSHLWEMQALLRGEESELHGLQVGIGTLLTLDIYDALRGFTPSRETADAFYAAFSDETWQAQMRGIFGELAPEIIRAEHEQHHKNSPEKHTRRLDNLLAHWAEIEAIAAEELPSTQAMRDLYDRLGMPKRPEDIGISAEGGQQAYIGSREIRDKYITSSMLWDLGLLDSFEYLNGRMVGTLPR